MSKTTTALKLLKHKQVRRVALRLLKNPRVQRMIVIMISRQVSRRLRRR